MFKENLPKKRPLFREFRTQKPTHKGGTYLYPQHVMLSPPGQNRMSINHSRISMFDGSYNDRTCYPKNIENEGGGTGYGFVFKMMPWLWAAPMESYGYMHIKPSKRSYIPPILNRKLLNLISYKSAAKTFLHGP